MDLFSALNTDLTDEKWVFFRSIFVSSKLEIYFEFSESAKQTVYPGDHLLPPPKMSEQMPYVFGKLKDFVPYINELKIYKGGE